MGTDPGDAPLRTHRRIAREIESMIDSGAFRAGERLPSTRTLARAKGASAATVMEAYESLAERGVITVRPRSGYFVAARRPAAPATKPVEANAAVQSPRPYQTALLPTSDRAAVPDAAL